MRGLRRFAEEMARVGEKGEHHGQKITLAGDSEEFVKQAAVPDVDSVEVAHGEGHAASGELRRRRNEIVEDVHNFLNIREGALERKQESWAAKGFWVVGGNSSCGRRGGFSEKNACQATRNRAIWPFTPKWWNW